MFSLRTEEASAKQYFQFYGYLSQQQNMMQVTHVVSLVLRPPPEGLGMRLVTTRDLSELKLFREVVRWDFKVICGIVTECKGGGPLF